MKINIVDLKENLQYLDQYIRLRNTHKNELFTISVSYEETKNWILSSSVVIKIATKDEILLGVVILYLAKDNEITIFTQEKNKGIGTLLLKEIEKYALEKGLTSIYSWIEESNEASKALFLKQKFSILNESIKKYNDIKHIGNIFQKELTIMKHTQNNYSIRGEAVEFPMMSVLSFSYVCNALCPNCPYTNSEIRGDYKDAKFMSADTFKKIADEVGQYNAWLRISGGGEPTMHPEFLELMIYAKEKGCKLGIITNGSMMDKSLAKSLLEIDVEMLEFSVDADNKKDYDVVRKGLSFDELVQNIKYTFELRNKINSKTKIIASAINQNEINVDEVEKFWLPFVDNFQKRKYLTWGINDASNSADDTPYLEPEDRVPCPFLFERLNIDSRGQIMMCGYDIAANTNMGNIHNASIKDIWHGKEFTSYRDKHLQRKGDDIELCKSCPDWKYRSWKHNYWKLVENAQVKKDSALNINDSEGSVEVE